MTALAILLFCLQACLVQNVYSQCIGAGLTPAFASRFFPPGLSTDLVPSINPSYSQSYGGEGVGDMAISGRMPVSGVTAVKGQVPIFGSVRFGGDVPAAGTVTITGRSGYRGYRGFC